MRQILAISGLGLFMALGAGSAFAEGPYAAIAFSPTTGQAGSSWNFDTEILAETEAFLQCGKDILCRDSGTRKAMFTHAIEIRRTASR